MFLPFLPIFNTPHVLLVINFRWTCVYGSARCSPKSPFYLCEPVVYPTRIVPFQQPQKDSLESLAGAIRTRLLWGLGASSADLTTQLISLVILAATTEPSVLQAQPAAVNGPTGGTIDGVPRPTS